MTVKKNSVGLSHTLEIGIPFRGRNSVTYREGDKVTGGTEGPSWEAAQRNGAASGLVCKLVLACCLPLSILSS